MAAWRRRTLGMRKSIIWQTNRYGPTSVQESKRIRQEMIQRDDGVVRALGGIRPTVRVQVAGIHCDWGEVSAFLVHRSPGSIWTLLA